MAASSSELFYQSLLSKRRSMGPGNRAKKFRLTGQWLYPWSIERAYAHSMGAFLRIGTDVFTRAITPAVNSLDPTGDELREDANAFQAALKAALKAAQKVYNTAFGGKGPPAVRAMITTASGGVSTWNSKQSQKFFKQVLGVEFLVTEPWEKEVLAKWGQINLELISNLSDTYIKDINRIVSAEVLSGGTSSSVMAKIKSKNKNITDARCRLIARDQVGKLNGELTQRRMADAGLPYYEWSTAMDERVRSTHHPLNRKLCNWADSSIYSSNKGKTWAPRAGIGAYVGTPGSDIQCRCTSLPWMDAIIVKADREIGAKK